MSCIRFNTPAQQRQLDRIVANPSLGAEAVAAFLSPEVTPTKISRLVRMASDRNHKIRESAALHKHTPPETLAQLALDRVESVRVCVARNEATPCDTLRRLSEDPSPRVRSWVAVNYFVPADVMNRLSNDSDPDVRSLVEWKSSLSQTTEQSRV